MYNVVQTQNKLLAPPSHQGITGVQIWVRSEEQPLIYKSYGREAGSAAVSAVCRVDRNKVYTPLEVLWERQIVGYELHTSATHKGLPHMASLDSFFSTGTGLSQRLHSDYWFRRQGEGSVRELLTPWHFYFHSPPEVLHGNQQCRDTSIKWKHRAAGSCDGGLALRKMGDTDFTL